MDDLKPKLYYCLYGQDTDYELYKINLVRIQELKKNLDELTNY